MRRLLVAPLLRRRESGFAFPLSRSYEIAPTEHRRFAGARFFLTRETVCHAMSATRSDARAAIWMAAFDPMSCHGLEVMRGTHSIVRAAEKSTSSKIASTIASSEA
jgi:hypothetical protein